MRVKGVAVGGWLALSAPSWKGEFLIRDAAELDSGVTKTQSQHLADSHQRDLKLDTSSVGGQQGIVAI